MSRATRPQPVVCSRCGQRGDERPGLRLESFEQLQAVILDGGTLVGDQLPQRLICLACGHSVAVPGGSIEVRKP